MDHHILGVQRQGRARRPGLPQEWDNDKSPSQPLLHFWYNLLPLSRKRCRPSPFPRSQTRPRRLHRRESITRTSPVVGRAQEGARRRRPHAGASSTLPSPSACRGIAGSSSSLSAPAQEGAQPPRPRAGGSSTSLCESVVVRRRSPAATIFFALETISEMYFLFFFFYF